MWQGPAGESCPGSSTGALAVVALRVLDSVHKLTGTVAEGNSSFNGLSYSENKLDYARENI